MENVSRVDACAQYRIYSLHRGKEVALNYRKTLLIPLSSALFPAGRGNSSEYASIVQKGNMEKGER